MTIINDNGSKVSATARTPDTAPIQTVHISNFSTSCIPAGRLITKSSNMKSLCAVKNSGPQLAAIFQSGAVLQRDCPIPVWGWAPPSQRVRITLAGAPANGWVSAQGEFQVILPPLPAGGPYELRVELPAATERQVLILEDIWLGEVWLGSGQSNMQWTLADCGEPGAQAVASANDPLLRMFTVERRAELAPQRDVEGCWQQATPDSALGFSAVAYHFARRLRSELGVCVGIILSAWGGTPIEAWLPRRAHVTSPLLSTKLRRYEERAYSDERWISTAGDNGSRFPADPGMDSPCASWALGASIDTECPAMVLPAKWQQCGHEFSGVFWFRKHIAIPESWVGQTLLLELGAVDKQDITFVNGIEVGRTGKGLEDRHWNQPRRYSVPAACVTSKDLLIAVRVYSFVYDGGLIGPKDHMRISCPEVGKESVSLAGDWHYQIEHNFGLVHPSGDPGHLSHHSPGILYDNMIAPLVPYAMRGVLWYQGESNSGSPAEYPYHLNALINDWRAIWELGEYPFLVVQLPGFGREGDYISDSTWALMRQGQLDLLQTVPDMGLAVTIDCGQADDIHPIHKEPVGHRLAQWALAHTYGKTTLRGGPLVEGAQGNKDGRVWIRFSDIGSGLTTTDGAPVAGVYLLDESGAEHLAQVSLQQDGLWAQNSACPHPVAVCYAWADFPLQANLKNIEGFPASPFKVPVTLLWQ
jgi:sialate O-acetylesterase